MNIRVLKDTKRGRGVFCYCIVYNEAWFLPRFLDHYRKLGVSYFIFYDDGSTDGTLDILSAQPDCMILSGPPHENKIDRDWTVYQTDLSNEIPEHFGQGQWSITVDADEFLVLPDKFADLNQLTPYLDHRGLKSVLAPMIGFYPERLAGRNYGETVSPFEGTPWFDRDMGFTRLSPRLRPVQAPGGIRVRLLIMLKEKHPERFERIFGARKYRYARLVKIPVLKTGQKIKRVDPHDIDRASPMGIQVGVAHFKFFPGSDQRVAESLARRNHYLNAVEYEFLDAIFELLGEESLISDRSVRFEKPRDMESAGLIWAN